MLEARAMLENELEIQKQQLIDSQKLREELRGEMELSQFGL